MLLVALTFGIRDTRGAPPYFGVVANQVLRLQGGMSFGVDMGVQAVAQLEQQVKRVMGADPSLELNVSALRDREDPELLRILFLAMLGNFSSAAGAEWGQTCSLVINPQTGLVAQRDPVPMGSTAIKVVLVLLVAVQVKFWVLQRHGGVQTKGE
jgi:hypothetical protein